MGIFQQTGRTDGYRRLHHIKECKKVLHQTVGQLGTKKSFQYRIVIRITQSHLIQSVGIHEFVKNIGTEHYRFRYYDSSIFKFIEFDMTLYHIVYKSKSASFPSQRPFTDTGKIGITVKTVTLKYRHHALILHLTILHNRFENYPAMRIYVLQRLPSNLFQELGRRKHGTGVEPTRDVVAADVIKQRFLRNGKDDIL